MDQPNLGDVLAANVAEGTRSFQRIGVRGILLRHKHSGGVVDVVRAGRRLAIVCRNTDGIEFSRSYGGAARLYLVASCCSQ